MPEINESLFWSRAQALHTLWKDAREQQFSSADVLLVLNGSSDDNIVFRKTLSLLLWLVGYELYDTAIAFTSSQIHILASAKKIKLFEKLSQKKFGISLNLLTLQKKSDSKAVLESFIKALGGESKKLKLGRILKDKLSGGSLVTLESMINDVASWSIVDVTVGISTVLATRSTQEIEDATTAARVSCAVLEKKLVYDMEEVINTGSETPHSKLAEDAANLYDSAEELQKLLPKELKKIDCEDVESCFHPIIQSGGNYNLKVSAQSDDAFLQADTVIISTGARFNSFCSSVARTYLIDPNKEQKQVYRLLLDVRSAVIDNIRPNLKASAVFKAAIKTIESSSPELLGNFSKNCGFMSGIEYRDSSFVLNARNDRRIPLNSIFIVSVGFSDVIHHRNSGKKGTFSALLCDTVLAGKDGPKNLSTTDPNYKQVTYFLDKDDDEQSIGSGGAVPMSLQVESADGRPRTRGRSSRKKQDTEAVAIAEERRKAAQQELARKKQEEAAKKYTSDMVQENFDADRSASKLVVRKSYKSVKEMPSDAIRNHIHVDIQAESVLIPINGRMVPLHISTVKNVSKYEEGDYSYFRLNLITPGSAAMEKLLPGYADPTKLFLKEITVRAADGRNLAKALRLIKELQKRVKQREIDFQAREEFAEQPDLILNKDRRFEFRLRDLQIRPSLGGKKITGYLTTHLNGLLFTSNRGQKLELLYSNIKQAFFQPADNTISVVMHFELRSPIKVNKKRTSYVQVYQEVVESSQDLGGSNKRGFYDRDGIQEEQQERIRRNKANERFRSFARQVEDVVEQLDPDNKFEFDIPYKDLMFSGVPGKSAVNVLPTVHGLVALDDNPPFVLSLDEVEIAYFERVQFSLKNFDLVFVFKDFERPIVKIRSIPIDTLDSIQQFLTDSNIVYYVGTVSLQWPRILKTIKEDAQYFFTEQGGWSSILGEDEDAEDNESEDEESDFAPPEAESDVGEEDSEEYESAEISDEYEEEESEEDDEAGPSWEELEQEAIREERADASESEDDRPSKRRRAARK